MDDNIRCLAALLEGSGEGAVLARDGEILAANGEAARLLGVKPGDGVGEVFGPGPAAARGEFSGSAVAGGVRIELRSAAYGPLRAFFFRAAAPGEPEEAGGGFELRRALEDLRVSARSISVKLIDHAELGLEGSSQALQHSVSRLAFLLINPAASRAFKNGPGADEKEELDVYRCCRDMAGSIRYFAKRRGILVTCGGEQLSRLRANRYAFELALSCIAACCLYGLKGPGGELEFTVVGGADAAGVVVESRGGEAASGQALETSRGLAFAAAASMGGSVLREAFPGGERYYFHVPAPREENKLRAPGISYARFEMDDLFTQLAFWLEDADFDARLMD